MLHCSVSPFHKTGQLQQLNILLTETQTAYRNNVGLSGLCDIVRNILQACALIVQVLQDHVTPIVQGCFWVGQQGEHGVVHPESLTCVRVA